MTNFFDQVAQNWDENPIHIERTKAIATELLKMIPLHKGMTALEFGSGTGLLSFALADQFVGITLMDSSIEMTKQATTKVISTGADHLKPLHFDLEKEDYSLGTFDAIFTQMAMHHVKDVSALIHKFYSLLNAGGFIAIADLYAEDGSFHDGNPDVHFGFDPDNIKEILTAAGFTNPILKPCFEIKRPGNEGNVKIFPVFLVVAKKP